MYVLQRPISSSPILKSDPDPLGAIDEAEGDEWFRLLVGELARPRHPAGVARAGARALVLPVEHRPVITTVRNDQAYRRQITTDFSA